MFWKVRGWWLGRKKHPYRRRPSQPLLRLEELESRTLLTTYTVVQQTTVTGVTGAITSGESLPNLLNTSDSFVVQFSQAMNQGDVQSGSSWELLNSSNAPIS